MKTIFDKIKGREWDWFKLRNPKYAGIIPKSDYGHRKDPSNYYIKYRGKPKSWDKKGDLVWWQFSLADLLANSSWCKAVWGEQRHHHSDNLGSRDCERDCELPAWYRKAITAFETFLERSEQAATDYIKKTMV